MTVNEGDPQNSRPAQKRQWLRSRFGKAIVAALGLFIVFLLLSLVPDSPPSRAPLAVGAFLVNLPFLVYHIARYVASRRGGDLPRRAQYAQLIKGNLLMAWWASVYLRIEPLPDAGAKGGLTPLLFLAGAWYLCTASRVRRLAEVKAEKARLAQTVSVGEPEAGTWPPPPSVP